jgi:hypothetical protein
VLGSPNRSRSMAEPGVQRCKHSTVLFSNGADVTRDPSAANNVQTQVEDEDEYEDEYERQAPNAERQTLLTPMIV